MVRCLGTMDTTLANDVTGTRAASTYATVLRLGPILLLIAGCITGPLGIHSTTDAWIALATGRHIVETGEVPTTDPFSYTFQGEKFFNQNWLSHLTYFVLNESIGPAAVAAWAWLMTLSIYGLVFYAVRIRSQSWLAAMLATGAMAALSRHYFDVRPHTFGYFCLAATCALLHSAAVRRERQRWWPMLLLLPILLYWSSAHGSFVFGYGLIGLFVACWAVDRLVKLLGIVATTRQIVAISSATLAALILTVALGPYGVSNFTHVLKIGGSKKFREVVEWQPPWLYTNHGLDVWPFWVALVLAVAALLVALVVWVSAPVQDVSRQPRRRGVPALTVFDALLVLMGLGMALWARRFAPTFYVLATPPLVTLIVRLAGPVGARVRKVGKLSLATLAWIAAIFCGAQTATALHAQLMLPFVSRPHVNLLQRVTGYDQFPFTAIRFLRQIDVEEMRVLSEWTVAGLIMYEIPQARVYMDGRAQQVYDEPMYLRFTGLFGGDRSDPVSVTNILNEHPTDVVVLRRVTRQTHGIYTTLTEAGGWTVLRFNTSSEKGGMVLLRNDAEVFQRLLQMERAGQLQWPANGAATYSRGAIWQSMTPPDHERAIEYFKTAMKQDDAAGPFAYPALFRSWVQLGRAEEAYAYFREERQRIEDARILLSSSDRNRMREMLDAGLRQLEDILRRP